MLNWRMLALLAGGLWLAASSNLTAQRWGREATPRDGVCLYEDADYRGDYFCARSGEDIGSIPPGMNDRISSVRLFGNAEVTVYKDGRFSGSSTRFDRDVRNLRDEGWNDRVSSVRVEWGRGGSSHWGDRTIPRDGACFYQDADYRGDYFCARSGEDLSSIPPGTNDRISSIRVLGRAEVTVYQDGRFHGRSERFSRDVRNLRNEGWNDLISSIEVRGGYGGHGHSDDRRSSGYHGEDPDRIVRRAYKDILDRDPDDAGLRLYRGRIVDDGWSESQVRDALRNSPEYKRANTMTRAKAEEIVRNAYRSVLGREPDSGSRGYVDRVLRDHWTQQDIERELKKSPEYRKH